MRMRQRHSYLQLSVFAVFWSFTFIAIVWIKMIRRKFKAKRIVARDGRIDVHNLSFYSKVSSNYNKIWLKLIQVFHTLGDNIKSEFIAVETSWKLNLKVHLRYDNMLYIFHVLNQVQVMCFTNLRSISISNDWMLVLPTS